MQPSAFYQGPQAAYLANHPLGLILIRGLLNLFLSLTSESSPFEDECRYYCGYLSAGSTFVPQNSDSTHH